MNDCSDLLERARHDPCTHGRARVWKRSQERLSVGAPALALAAFAGLRLGEIRALTWADVDLEGRDHRNDATATALGLEGWASPRNPRQEPRKGVSSGGVGRFETWNGTKQVGRKV